MQLLKPSFLIAVLAFSTAWAALPPRHQNNRDLDVMVGFINEHRDVSMTLRQIDFNNFTVHYGDNCIAKFVRKKRLHMPGWVGPREPLVFRQSSCPLEAGSTTENPLEPGAE